MRLPSLVAAVDRALRAAGVPPRGGTIVVGLSGGKDSVALTDALASPRRRRGFRVVAAHLDHGLRPGSAEDVAFCAALCERLDVPFRAGNGRRARPGRARAGRPRAGRAPRALRLPAPRAGRGEGGRHRGRPHARRPGGDAPAAAPPGRRGDGPRGHEAEGGRRRPPAARGVERGGPGAPARAGPRLARGPLERRHRPPAKPRAARAHPLPRGTLQPGDQGGARPHRVASRRRGRARPRRSRVAARRDRPRGGRRARPGARGARRGAHGRRSRHDPAGPGPGRGARPGGGAPRRAGPPARPREGPLRPPPPAPRGA